MLANPGHSFYSRVEHSVPLNATLAAGDPSSLGCRAPSGETRGHSGLDFGNMLLQFSGNRAWLNDRHPNMVPIDLLAQRLGKGPHAPFRGVIDRAALADRAPRHRGDIDDMPAALRLHQRQRLVRGNHQALDYKDTNAGKGAKIILKALIDERAPDEKLIDLAYLG
jgi:hypothetical protein